MEEIGFQKCCPTGKQCIFGIFFLFISLLFSVFPNIYQDVMLFFYMSFAGCPRNGKIYMPGILNYSVNCVLLRQFNLSLY